MKKNLLLALSISLMATAFVGCGSTEEEAPTPTEEAVVESTAPTSEETVTPEAGTAETSGNTMTFYNGEMELPTEFDNFVVMDYTLIDQFVSLGVAPSHGQTPAVAESRYYEDWTRVFGDFDLNSIVAIDQKSETYMEEIVSHAPDFIIISESSERELEKYEAIAPTYVFPAITEAPEGTAIWKEELKFVGEFVGKSDMAEELIATYDQLVADSRALVADEIEGKTALVLQLNEKGFKIRMPEDQASVYADMGFGVPEGLDSSFASTSVSNEDGSFPVEQIIEFNPDYIFVHLQSADSYNALVGTPVWDGIQAVKDGRVYETTQSAWNHLNGYLTNTHRINELVYFITEDKQTMPEYAILD